MVNESYKEKAKARLHLALDIGEEMLISGAEVSRVEDTISRICRAFGAERIDVFTITSSIIVTMYSQDSGPITQTRRINGQATDLLKLEQLNQLSREICTTEMSEQEIRERMRLIMGEKKNSIVMQAFLYAAISSSFTLFFGGSIKDAIASALIGVVLNELGQLWKKLEANIFLSAFLSSFMGGVLAIILVYLGLGDSVSKINIGNIMLLIPGIRLTNSMRDMFSGDTISGTLSFVESVLLAMTLAGGFAIASTLGGRIL